MMHTCTTIVASRARCHKSSAYGDPAYPLRGPVIAPFLGLHLTAEQELFNKNMISVHQSVEWGFGKVLQLFPFVDYKKNLKLLRIESPKFRDIHGTYSGVEVSSLSLVSGVNPTVDME